MRTPTVRAPQGSECVPQQPSRDKPAMSLAGLRAGKSHSGDHGLLREESFGSWLARHRSIMAEGRGCLFLHPWGEQTALNDFSRRETEEDKVTRKTGGESAWCRGLSPPRGEGSLLSEVGVPALRAREVGALKPGSRGPQALFVRPQEAGDLGAQ